MLRAERTAPSPSPCRTLSTSCFSLCEPEMARFLQSGWNADLITLASKLQAIEETQSSLKHDLFGA